MILRAVVLSLTLWSVFLWPEVWFEPQEVSLASIMGIVAFTYWFAKGFDNDPTDREDR